MTPPSRTTGPRLPHVMQLRLTDEQRRYLLFQAAANETFMSDVVRACLDSAIRRAKPLHLEGEENLPDELRSTIPLRVVLAGLDESALEELAARHGS